MAVAHIGTDTSVNSGGTVSSQDLNYTLSAGSNLMIVVAVNYKGAPSSPTCVWDPTGVNQSFTRVGTGIDNPVPPNHCEMFYLLTSTTGAKVIRAAGFTTLSVDVGATAFSGAGGIAAGDTQTYSSGGGVVSTTSIPAIPSAANDATAACCVNNSGNITTTTQTQFYSLAAVSPRGAGSYALGGASNTHTFTFPADQVCGMGFHITASGGAITPWPGLLESGRYV